MGQRYERILRIRGSELRIQVDGATAVALHDGQMVARRVGDVGLLVFTVVEAGERVDYDIAVLRSGQTRVFVGRKGELVYSDDPAMPVDKISEV